MLQAFSGCRAAKSEQHRCLCRGPPAGADRGAGDLELLPPDHVFLDNRNAWGHLSCPGHVVEEGDKKRREQIRLGLPDAVDLMVVCVDAGLGLDQALLRTGEELGTSHAVLAEELTQINLEQRAGKPRVDAWRDMRSEE